MVSRLSSQDPTKARAFREAKYTSILFNLYLLFRAVSNLIYTMEQFEVTVIKLDKITHVRQKSYM